MSKPKNKERNTTLTEYPETKESAISYAKDNREMRWKQPKKRVKARFVNYHGGWH